ncbi:muconolactone Delta-isomerase family protein [Amycolatopsis mongoliensis]|uniref:Muconolactone Delta-isomerase family protein n=1 Tax=Amycolatopsis mongoliensis TaxID=715475 RepID=A0A9Y2JJ01_9PSEU|nr:muconolactone Delta-isomerase family protein [Amycolatopsis sp. 4-36]WIX98355.1 muconolactone Delta-isomerase family protein [Amycolatopsis sp. 4-36]
MKEFLVELTVTVPEGTDQAEVDRRRAAEAVRAGELAAEGHLSRLWRTAGEPRVVAVWRADDETELREKVLESLPMWPWATAVITALQPHPQDPVQAAWAVAAGRTTAIDGGAGWGGTCV